MVNSLSAQELVLAGNAPVLSSARVKNLLERHMLVARTE